MYNYSVGNRSRYFVLTADLIFPLIVILLVVAGGLVAFKSRLFTVTEIVCTLDYQPCPESSVTAELDKYKGRNLLELDTKELVNRLTAGDFTIREAVFRKKFPGTLVADLQSVYPSAAVKVRGVENEWLVVDSRHRVIRLLNSNPNVATVVVPSPPSVRIGQEITDPELLQALEFARVITAELSQVKSVSQEGHTVSLELSGGKTALFSTDKDLTVQIQTLQAILADTTMSSGVTVIDVRFSKPVLK